MDSTAKRVLMERIAAAQEQQALALVALAAQRRLIVSHEDGRLVMAEPHPDQVVADGPQVKGLPTPPKEAQRMGQGMPWAWAATPYGCIVECAPDGDSPFGFRVRVVQLRPGGERQTFDLAAPMVVREAAEDGEQGG